MTILRNLPKAPDALRTIKEIADELGELQSTLRFWERQFSAVRPMRRGGLRRYYRPGDVDLVRGIHRMLRVEGCTIRDVQKILAERGRQYVIE